jgi:hypothetical protein
MGIIQTMKDYLQLLPPRHRTFALIVLALIAAIISAWKTYEIVAMRSSCSGADVGIHGPGKVDDALLLNNRIEDNCNDR